MLRCAIACSQPQRALPLLHRQWQQLPLSLAARRGLSSAPAPGGGSGGSSVGGGRGPRNLRLFSVPGGWRMARKSEEELAKELEEGSGSPRFPFKVRRSRSAAVPAACRHSVTITCRRQTQCSCALPTHCQLPPNWRFHLQDEFEIARGLVLNAEQVVETLQPLMTPERIARIERVRRRQQAAVRLQAVSTLQ